jgi:D-glycero-alpha-D-manno-heptose-7-phosphate kinase
VSREIVARAPTRIDLGGGWTDVPPYCEREGGFVCNVAIARHAVVRVSQNPVYSTSGTEMPLLDAVVRRSGVRGVGFHIRNDFPVAAGLGGSSAACVALLGALAEWQGRPWERSAIAEEGRQIEVEDLGIAGGRQDYYAATHGGALGLSFSDKVVVQRIPLAAETRQQLVSRSVLVYTGQSRVSGDTITAVLSAYEQGERRVVRALQRMRELAIDMAAALEAADLDAVGGLLNEHWEYQRSLHPSIPTARIDEIIGAATRAGALGAKAMGASGGGCVLILARADNADVIRSIVGPMGDIVDFDVDEEGVSVGRAA